MRARRVYTDSPYCQKWIYYQLGNYEPHVFIKGFCYGYMKIHGTEIYLIAATEGGRPRHVPFCSFNDLYVCKEVAQDRVTEVKDNVYHLDF